MIARKDIKVPDGKLLRVEVEVESGVVIKAVIGGDFFAHPEEEFERAESELHGLPVNRLGEAALALFSRPGLKLLGVSAFDIANALMETARGTQVR